METMEFNLLQERWVRVRTQDCTVQEVSLTDALLHAHAYVDLAGEMPTQDAAMLRLQLAVLHTVFSRVDGNGVPAPFEEPRDALQRWGELWQLGHFPEQPIRDYLDKWQDRFWLFHPERPFWQVPEAKIGSPFGAKKLNGEVFESENKSSLFSACAGTGKESMDYPQAARWLVSLNNYDDAAAKKKAKDRPLPSMGPGWLGRIGVIYVKGSNLFETLMRNLMFLQDGGELWEPDVPCWELEDGFGVGAMPDVPQVRPADCGANTCVHIFERTPDLKLPNLASLGLANIVGREFPGLPFATDATFGRAELMHDGADTFFGHQEIMGTRPAKPFGEPICNKIELIKKTLEDAGYHVRYYTGTSGKRLLIVNEACTVADNVECDPGQAFNVTAAIDDLDFEEELKIGHLVRSVSVVPRVITFGGRGVHLQNLLDAIEEHGDYIGVNAPASGVYNNDYHCIHMGYGVDPEVQIPTILGKSGLPVFLLGKVADVVTNNYGTSIPMVDTASVLQRTLEIVKEQETAFICTNVQETDLCGHRENVAAYADRLRVADEWIGKIRDALGEDDILIVQADHGNDPTIGHPHHTREMVPLMIHSAHSTPKNIGIRKTLSDVGATAADYFHSKAPENGTSFLPLLLK